MIPKTRSARWRAVQGYLRKARELSAAEHELIARGTALVERLPDQSRRPSAAQMALFRRDPRMKAAAEKVYQTFFDLQAGLREIKALLGHLHDD